jgi:hypothetical protein
MKLLQFIMFVVTCAFCFFLHNLWAGQYSPADLLGLIASVSGITLLFTIGEA